VRGCHALTDASADAAPNAVSDEHADAEPNIEPWV
jgi:hypothetical protein